MMAIIIKANEKDFQLLADIGRTAYIESHGSSAKPGDINMYLNKNYSYEVIKDELRDSKNIYHIICHDRKTAGYSKIIFNAPHPNIQTENITKLERLYLLKEFYGLKSGFELFQFNLELSKKNKQSGMWLFVWKENQRAIVFYKKAGFKITGSHDFKLTETHSVPNYQMFLEY